MSPLDAALIICIPAALVAGMRFGYLLRGAAERIEALTADLHDVPLDDDAAYDHERNRP
jgi:hypothetical protein